MIPLVTCPAIFPILKGDGSCRIYKKSLRARFARKWCKIWSPGSILVLQLTQRNRCSGNSRDATTTHTRLSGLKIVALALQRQREPPKKTEDHGDYTPAMAYARRRSFARMPVFIRQSQKKSAPVSRVSREITEADDFFI